MPQLQYLISHPNNVLYLFIGQVEYDISLRVTSTWIQIVRFQYYHNNQYHEFDIATCVSFCEQLYKGLRRPPILTIMAHFWWYIRTFQTLECGKAPASTLFAAWAWGSVLVREFLRTSVLHIRSPPTHQKNKE